MSTTPVTPDRPDGEEVGSSAVGSDSGAGAGRPEEFVAGTSHGERGHHSSPGRRGLLGAGAAGLALGAAAGVGGMYGIRAVTSDASISGGSPDEGPLTGTDTIPFYGEHQAGVETPPQARVSLLGLDLAPETTAADLGRLFRVLTDDIMRLTQGTPALADSEPELAAVPARLTVTVGVGRRTVEIAGAPVPEWLGPLPAFEQIDQLEDEWSEGDLLLQVCGDDALSVAHAQRMLLKSCRSFARVRWVQQGFRNSRGSVPGDQTQRNLMGQIDGTVNPVPGTPDFDSVVWIREGWLAGGTSMVVRRIRMTLDTWDELGRAAREQVIGRTLDTGAPLTGTAEHDVPDLTATNDRGFTIIPEFAHIARAAMMGPQERMLRRPYNYDMPPRAADGISDSGLLFIAFQADVNAQFLPIQQRLAELDLLNQWTIPIGSSVFAILPGVQEGQILGQTMLDAGK